VVVASTVFIALFILLGWASLRRLVGFAAAGAAVVVAFYTLPVASYGLAVIATESPNSALPRTLYLLLAGPWSLFGAVGLSAVAVLLALRYRREERLASPGEEQRAWAWALAASMVVQAVAFIALPADAGYLIPAVAMLWLLLGLFANQFELRLAVLAAVAGSLLPGILLPSVLEDGAERRDQVVESRAILAAVQELPRGSVVVVRTRLPELMTLAGEPPGRGVDPAGADARFVLDGGQVLTYNFSSADADAPVVYRLAGVSGVPQELPTFAP
jgi:hypothetical protein